MQRSTSLASTLGWFPDRPIDHPRQEACGIDSRSVSFDRGGTTISLEG